MIKILKKDVYGYSLGFTREGNSYFFSCSNLEELANNLAYCCLPHMVSVKSYGDIHLDEPKNINLGNLQNYVYSVLMSKTSVRDMISKFNAIEKSLEL